MTTEEKRMTIIKFYEEETGLSATRGKERINRLEEWMNTYNLDISDINIYDDTNKIGRDWNNGLRWNAGTFHGDTILLGQTSGRGNFVFKNAIFAQSDKIDLDSE